MFRSTIMAGFDCARLEWQNDLCLLTATDHVPERRMREHYELMKAHGVHTVRDGLPWWHPIEPRLQVAKDAGMEVIWDLDHYWRHPAPTDYAKRVAMAVQRVCPGQTFWVCFNENRLAGLLTPGQDQAEVVAKAKEIMRVLRANIYDVRLVTAEPAHIPDEIEAHAGLADQADVLGINIYPYHADWSIGEALRAMAARYPDRPLMITETGLHPGLDRKWEGIDCKAEWLRHVRGEVRGAQHWNRINVVGICLYPIVNTPSWNDPRERWDHGLIREDGSVDEALSAAMMEAA
ncbi:hypothetical protein NGM99_13835 [Mesorhizobium sp. RP14(2022)]|uniref:Arabinogalactan endo-beta-1,4-galactanase n=1 Tax=Mesorhizobium liriopis TaxID=2953882 RepID=A0ABT1C7R1_9HYPH|nr:hypothetical protein [Mesorhizobium liriopis]MCO6050860.1 hypothetical protein [Mesorhizobium liriopis]